MCTEGLQGQEPGTPCLSLCALAGPPLCTTEQLYQPGVLNRSPRALWGSSAWVWRQEPQIYPGWGSVLPAPLSPSPTRGCPAPPSTGASVPHKHQGKPTLLLTGSISALSPCPLYTGTGERDLHPTCI